MEEGVVYHVTTKSIAEYIIFNKEAEYLRMKQLFEYYRIENPPLRFSYFTSWGKERGGKKFTDKGICQNEGKLIRIIAYCIMPTHIHLILEQMKKGGISTYMRRVLNSYTRYFNIRYHRKGPLWEGRFKRIFVKTDEQLIHLTRYIHLNPVTAYLVDKPDDWQFSSYREYITKGSIKDKVCEFQHIMDIDPSKYKKFVNDQISYQRELAAVKKLILE